MTAGLLIPALFGVTLISAITMGIISARNARKAREWGEPTDLAKHDNPVGRKEQAD